MVLQRLSLSQRWLTSFSSPRLILLLPILKTLFYLHSFAKTLKSLTSTTERITKVIYAYKMACIGLFSNLMSRNVKKIGVSTSLTSQQLELTCVSRVFSSLAMSNILFFVLPLPLSNRHLIPSLRLSVLWISIANTLQHADSHPDHEVWLQSYYEEKWGIKSLGTFKKIALGESWAFRKKGGPKAIPNMCVLTIKKDENLLPLRAKSRILVLGNHEDRVWSKSNRFAPVLCQDTLCFLVSLAVEKHCPICQGDCKNAFCQGIFPLMKSLSYALLLVIQRPIHRNFGSYNALSMAFDAVLATGMTKLIWLTSIGLTPSLEDPYLYLGFVHDPSAPSGPKLTFPLTLGLYVDDFVYFSEDPAVESLFCHLLAKRCKVDFMGIIEWFLGIHISWRLKSSLVAVHLNQFWDLHLNWLKASSGTHGTLLQWLRLIDQVSLLMPLSLPRRKTTLQLWNDAKKPIQA